PWNAADLPFSLASCGSLEEPLTRLATRRHHPSTGRVRLGSADPRRTQGRRGAFMKLTERKIEKLQTDRDRKDRLGFDYAQRGLAVRGPATRGRTHLCQHP